MFKSLASFFVIVVLLVGCKSKSEECIAPAIDKNLVGIRGKGKVKENTCTKIVLDVFGLYTVELTK